MADFATPGAGSTNFADALPRAAGYEARCTAWMNLRVPSAIAIDLSHLTDAEFESLAAEAVGEPLAERLRATSGKALHPARLDESWPTDHEADCASRAGGDCSCPMGNL